MFKTAFDRGRNGLFAPPTLAFAITRRVTTAVEIDRLVRAFFVQSNLIRLPVLIVLRVPDERIRLL